MYIEMNPTGLTLTDLICVAHRKRSEDTGFPYAVQSCRCSNCRYVSEGKCSLKECCCMAERVRAHTCTFAEILNTCFANVKDNVFHYRLRLAAERATMAKTCFLDREHRTRFMKALHRMRGNDKKLIAQLFVLTATESLWCASDEAIEKSSVSYALLVLFFLMGIMKHYNSMQEIKRPEQALKLFIRFVLAKAAVTWGLDLMMAMFTIVQGIISKIMASSGIGGRSGIYLPGEMIKTIEDCGFWESIPLWAVTLIGSLLIWVLSFILILTVYGRMFKLFMYAAIAPIPLSSFAGEETGNIGRSFLKSFAGVCLEGAIIVLACVIYSLFASAPPSVSTGASAITQVWTYVGEIVFNMLVLVGTVNLSDQVVSKMLGI